MCCSTLDIDSKKAEPTTCPCQGTPQELPPALQQVIFSPLQSTLEVFKRCFANQTLFEPYSLFDATFNQESLSKSLWGLTLLPPDM